MALEVAGDLQGGEGMCVSDRVTGGQVRTVIKDSHPAGLGQQSSQLLGR